MAGLRWFRRWGPAMVGAAAIWILSTQAFSDASTERFIVPGLAWFFPTMSPESLFVWHGMIRKFAHILVYLTFCLLVLRAIRGDRRGWRVSWAIAALVIAGCYAVLDELHQSFVPARRAFPRDVMFDWAGAGLALVFTWWRHHGLCLRAGQNV